MSQDPPILEYLPRQDMSRRWRWILIVQAIQAALIFAMPLFLFITDPTTTPSTFLGAAFCCLIISALQWMLLAPITKPRIDLTRSKSSTYWISAGVAGLLVGILVFVAVGLLTDLLWAQRVIPSTEESHMDDATANAALILGFILFFVSWIIMTPLLALFMKNSSPEKALFQIAASIFLGTVIEALSSIGILNMMQKRNSCLCATFSFFAIFCSVAMAFLVLGPGILLLVFWRRSRSGSRGFCPACGANLKPAGNPSRCPQCGIGWKPYPN